jgi:hypothetical protein
LPNLLRSSRGRRWWPDADATNAPDGALLVADNLVPDMESQLSLRAGSTKVYENMETRVHSLYTALLNGETFRFAGCDDQLFRNGVDFGVTFDGAGDIAMGDDAYQAFFARGTIKKKFDGRNLYNWAIPAPEFPATLTAVPAITTTIASFDTSESPALVVNEGTSSFVTGYDGTSNGALKLVPAATGRASASKTFSSDQNFLDFSGAVGGDTDLFDIFVWIEEPTVVDKITIMFGLGTGADPFLTDYYYFDFSIRDQGTVDIKDPNSAAAGAYSIIAERTRSILTPSEITNVKTPDQVVAILKRLGRFAGPRSRERKDPQQNSPAWTHLSVTRGQFNRVGGTAGRNWETVRGFKVVYGATAGTTKALQCDSAVWTGGGNRSLTGKFALGYRFVRNFDDHYFELSPISPISDTIDLTQQSLQVTIPATSLANKDPQVNEIWVYLNGGFLDTYYRFAVVSATVRQGMTIDELTNPAGSNFNSATERTRLAAWGLTNISGAPASSDLIFTINKSELDALIENEKLEPGSVGAPDDIVAIVGPFNSRMFVLTAEGRMYPSSQDNPSSFSLYHHLDLRRFGNPLWAVMTGGGIYAGFSKDVVRIGGTGDESDDRISVDLFPEPLHVGNPPIDQAVVTDGNSVLYRSIDGPMLLSGVALQPVPPMGTDLLWRGQDRHGISSLNTAWGRFRFAIDNHILYMLAPEGTVYTPPLTEEENINWSLLTGVEADTSGILTKTAVSGFGNTVALATKSLESGAGYIKVVATETNTQRAFGLTTEDTSDGDYTRIDWCIFLGSDGQLSLFENGSQVSTQVPYVVGDELKVEVSAGIISYKKNDVLLYTSAITAMYPLAADVAMNQLGATLGPLTIFGQWLLFANSSDTVWRFSLVKQQWSRTVYPVRFMSFSRDPNGSLIAGTDGGEIWELEVGVQDDGEDIAINYLTPIDDGGDPLARKDALDLQLHVNTGGRIGTAAFYLDGAVTATDDFEFSTSVPAVHRANVLSLGVLLKAQMRITGSFNKFVLHAHSLQYRNRVQQVMVLDTGTISPQGLNTMVWFTEVELDCISPADLEMDIYLDDTQRGEPLPVPVIPGKRSSYRIVVPRGTKARAPRLVFRTTNPDGASNPGFEAYRVRIRDRGTGTTTENGFRPVWPVGTAP